VEYHRAADYRRSQYYMFDYSINSAWVDGWPFKLKR
jgi:hypothetical protein